MSIPLDRLYHYIENIAKEIRGDDVIIYRFFPHGSKNIADLHWIREYSWTEYFYSPVLICYDQEPLYYDLYANEPIYTFSEDDNNIDLRLVPKRNLRRRVNNLYDKCLLLHSEKNSPELIKYQKNQFIPVYYWSHAVIAQDWFRYAQHQSQLKKIKKTFLIYNRAWSGTREYRLKFMDLLIKHNLVSNCQTTCNSIDPNLQIHYRQHQYINPLWAPDHCLEEYLDPTISNSWASAEINIADYNATEFEIVLETLFDDSRIQLTEKILRPIACGQPFILVSTPGSLKYLQSYGFKTFADVIDESYDLINNPLDRLTAIIKSMQEIVGWTGEEKVKKMQQIKNIVDHNKQHFFSNKFLNNVLLELKNNLSTALLEVVNTNTGQRYLNDAKFVKNLPNMKHYYRQLSTQNRNERAIAIKYARKLRKDCLSNK